MNKKILIIPIIAIFLSSCTSNIDIKTLNSRANDLMNQGDIDGAIARLESINDLNPNFHQNHYNLGIAYHKKHQYDKAISCLNHSINLKNNFADAYYSLGVVYEEKADYMMTKSTQQEDKKLLISIECLQNSKDAFQKYIELSPDSPDVENIRQKVEYIDKDIQKYQIKLADIGQ